MKIKKLQIKNYKNLDANLEHKSDLIALIGNNGSGKSNLLEAISIIFSHFYAKKEKDIPFNFIMEYEIGGNKQVFIEKKNTSVTTKIDNIHKADISAELPKQIIAIYSGEEDRLWKKSYAPHYFEYIKLINSSEHTGFGEYIQFPKMLFINKFYWHISLLCLLLSEENGIPSFCKDIVNVKKINSIRFVFNKDNYKNYSDSAVKRFIQILDKKSEYSLIELKKLIQSNNYQLIDVYRYLYISFTPDKKKMLENIIIKFNDENLEIEDLSEGEKKLLLIKGALEFAGQEDSVFILDEPDAHIHINNKEQITNSFTNYLHNRQIILTTHSPTLTQCVNDENVHMLNSGKIVDKPKQEIIEEITGEFWNKHQQTSFISSKKPIILLVEGKHDKEHISNAFNKLRDEYPELSFDIFYMNSACNIPPMMTGLRTSEIDYKKIFIGIFDDDPTGKIELNNTTCKFPELQNAKRHKEGYFSFAYPKHAEHKSTIFTVENFFDPIHLENAYNLALSEFSGKFKGKSIESISEDIKDKAKTKLFENSKTFANKEDFKYFRKLFDIIKEIKKYNDDNKVAVTVVKSTKLSSSSVSPVVPSPALKISAKDNHLEYWTAFKKFIVKQKVSFKVQKPQAQHWTNITIGKSDFRLALIANTQKKWICVQLICLGKNSLIDFRKLKAKYELDSKNNLSKDIQWKENVGKKEHHINLVFLRNNPFDKENWENQFKILSEWTEKFYNYFKDKLNIPIFKASVKPLKVKQGRSFVTKVEFDGEIKNGFFDNLVVNKKTKQKHWKWDYETLPKNAKNTDGGILNGNVKIVKEFPSSTADLEKGEYTVYSRIYEHPVTGESTRNVIDEHKFDIEII